MTETGSELARMLPYASLTATSLDLDADITEDQYFEVGKKLALIETASQWWIGDWLNAADPAYGEHKALCESVGLNFNTAKTYAWTCKQIGVRTPNSPLSFEHHKQVAALAAPEQKTWLDRASKGDAESDKPWTTGKLRAEMRRSRLGDVPTLEGVYRVVLADPPWDYGKSIDKYGPADRHYPTMTMEELCELNIEDIAADDSVLFLWVTSPFLDRCWQLIEAWGFEYKASFIWDKQKHNYGNYNSVRHEFLLVCTRGSCAPEANKLFDSVVSVERSSEHSQKPQEFYDIIETLYPSGNRIELFARNERQGWARWGNES